MTCAIPGCWSVSYFSAAKYRSTDICQVCLQQEKHLWAQCCASLNILWRRSTARCLSQTLTNTFSSTFNEENPKCSRRWTAEEANQLTDCPTFPLGQIKDRQGIITFWMILTLHSLLFLVFCLSKYDTVDVSVVFVCVRTEEYRHFQRNINKSLVGKRSNYWVTIDFRIFF